MLRAERASEENELVIAKDGNGQDAPLTEEQMKSIHDLFSRVESDRNALLPASEEQHSGDADESGDFCDLETCRRFLVARKWNPDKAEVQLRHTLQWRLAEKALLVMKFEDSPKAAINPYAQNMRVVGTDNEGRPVIYTCFAEASDRWDVNANMKHVTLLMEASAKMIRKRRGQGLMPMAHQRQCVWIVDFDGFGLRDQSPKSALLTSQLLEHYPEMMHLIVLLGAPWLFGATWKLVSTVLDARVKRKVMFVKKDQELESMLRSRLGDEAAQWIKNEIKDNEEQRLVKDQKGPKKYWAVPTSNEDHDARGMASYVGTEYYIRTPGDSYEET